ncbi:hypothetical protein H4582DRAFT_1968624 [Lactarius indigo]|nr:hypothetical protein H4582DRAFT_1968624 [Lactarius indigo]
MAWHDRHLASICGVLTHTMYHATSSRRKLRADVCLSYCSFRTVGDQVRWLVLGKARKTHQVSLVMCCVAGQGRQGFFSYWLAAGRTGSRSHAGQTDRRPNKGVLTKLLFTRRDQRDDGMANTRLPRVKSVGENMKLRSCVTYTRCLFFSYRIEPNPDPLSRAAIYPINIMAGWQRLACATTFCDRTQFAVSGKYRSRCVAG